MISKDILNSGPSVLPVSLHNVCYRWDTDPGLTGEGAYNAKAISFHSFSQMKPLKIILHLPWLHIHGESY